MIGPDDFVGPDLGPNRLPLFTRAWLNFFTLTFRALGRNHIDCQHRGDGIAMLIFKSEKTIHMCVLIFPQNMMFLHLCLTI